MDIRTPEPEKVPVVTYDFYNQTGAKVLGVDLWPELGDVVTPFKDRYVFSFPRLHIEQEVFTQHVLSVMKTEAMRVYMTPTDILKKLEEKRQREAEAHDAKG